MRLSARYCSSPTLTLRIGNSPLRSALYTALCLIVAFAIWSLYTRGIGLFLWPLSLFVTILLWRLRNDQARGLALHWRQGIWILERESVERVVALGEKNIATSWVVYLSVTDLAAARKEHLWVYADSVSESQLRRLRVRLTLQH